MELIEFLKLIKRKKQTILSIVLVILLVLVIFTVIQPLEHSTKSRVMLVQNFKEGTDPYTAAKSNEYLSVILSKVILSRDFFDEVMESGYRIKKDYFSNDLRKEMNKWNKMVDASSINDTGIIVIEVFHKDRYQSEQIASAINHILKVKHTDYHGGGDLVSIKIIDKPITSNWPVKPNILFNLIFGLIFGITVALIYINIFPEGRYDIRIFPKRRMKKRTFLEESEWRSVGGLVDEKYNELNIDKHVEKK